MIPARESQIAHRAACREVAEDVFPGDAMMASIDEADPDATLSRMTTCSEDGTVELHGDHDGEIPRRLPKWTTVGSDDTTREADAPG